MACLGMYYHPLIIEHSTHKMAQYTEDPPVPPGQIILLLKTQQMRGSFQGYFIKSVISIQHCIHSSISDGCSLASKREVKKSFKKVLFCLLLIFKKMLCRKKS